MQRRRLLQLVAGGAAGSPWWRSDRIRASTPDSPSSREGSPTGSDEFDPAVHGFGFSNWVGNTGRDADGDEFTYEPGEVTREDVRRTIEDSWRSALSKALKSLMTRIVYSWIGGNAATNGHCYGMAFSVDRYFRDPEQLPAGVDAASAIPRPTGVYDRVGDRIRQFQTSQLLHAESYWYALLGLRWGLADHSESLRRLTETVDASGTSGLVLNGEPGPHLVLAYGYERADGVTDVFVYDPNHEADDHEDPDDNRMLRVDNESGEIIEIEEGYDQFLYHDPEMDLSVVDRLIGGRDRVLDQLSNAVFLGLETGETLVVDVPEGVLVDRPTAEYADPERAPYADSALVIGPPDEFGVTIEGEAGGEYSLDMLGLRDGNIVLEEEVSDTFDEGTTRLRFTIDEAGEFVFDVAEDVEEGAEEGAEEAAEKGADEELGEMNDGVDWLEDNWWLPAAGGALGIGAAYRFLARRLDDEDET